MSNFKYEVRHGDTVESIALKVGIPAADIRAFHNKYCEIWQLIEFGLPIKNTQYVLIPSLNSFLKKEEKKENALNKVIFGSDKTLHLSAIKELQRKYGTTVYYKENNRLINKIHFTSQIDFIKNQDDFTIVEFKINQVYINNKEPDLIIEKLADKTSKVLYPIVLALNKNGEIHKILNIEDIQRRWKNLKPSITSYYKGGNEVTELIASFEKNIQTAVLLKRSLAQHPFYKIYFSPIYQNYSADLCFTASDFKTKSYMHVDEFQNTTGKFFVRRKEITEVKNNSHFAIDTSKGLNELELKNKAFKAGEIEEGISGNSYLGFKLHHEDNTIFSIKGFINSRKDDQTIAVTEFETYEIELENKIRNEKEEIIVPASEKINWNTEIINQQEIEERGFWDKFFGR